MTDKEQIENLDTPTICDNCIHDEVCGLEGHLEPALKYCGWKEEERPQGEWIDIYSSHIAYMCSNCGLQTPICDYYHFCPNCGTEMTKEAENE